jgi:hypothetical protein
MVHFFGILGPGPLARNHTEEAPAKANFFGGLPDRSEDIPSRLEQEASYLSGKAPEPKARSHRDEKANGADDQ